MTDGTKKQFALDDGTPVVVDMAVLNSDVPLAELTDLLAATAVWNTPRIPEKSQREIELENALHNMLTLHNNMMRECNLGNSFLSNETVQQMNTYPTAARVLLAGGNQAEGV